MNIDNVIHQELPSKQAELAQFFKKFPRNAEVFIKNVPAGNYCILEGEPCLYVYVVLAGKVAARHYSGYNAFVANHFGRLSVLGDIAALGGLETYSTSIKTLTNCRLLEVRISDYWDWLLSDRKILKNQTQIAIGILLRELTEKRTIEEKSSEIRLLSYFVSYCTKEAFYNRKIIEIKETRERIADEVGGISIRTVNRKISRFAAQGLINVVHGKIQISFEQLQKMQRIVGGQDEEDY